MKYLKKQQQDCHNDTGYGILSSATFAQSAKYQRKKSQKRWRLQPRQIRPKGRSSEKENRQIDISDLEQKYWGTKDTDYSVVQTEPTPKIRSLGFHYWQVP